MFDFGKRGRSGGHRVIAWAKVFFHNFFGKMPKYFSQKLISWNSLKSLTQNFTKEFALLKISRRLVRKIFLVRKIVFDTIVFLKRPNFSRKHCKRSGGKTLGDMCGNFRNGIPCSEQNRCMPEPNRRSCSELNIRIFAVAFSVSFQRFFSAEYSTPWEGSNFRHLVPNSSASQ